MKIKGFDKNLCCRGMQFEIGKTYDTGAKDNELQLCSNTVFHYCDDLQSVHSYYSCNEDNRFCEVEVLGAEVTDGGKCGSNRIKIVREITGSELDSLKGATNGNTGLFNTGNWNTGDWNKCDYSNGIFCSRSPKIHIFNMPSDFTLEEFRMSKYYAALTSAPFVLTEWIGYSGEEKKACPQKELTGGYLKSYTYEEACKNWWDEMTEENKEIVLSMPNFNSEIFKEITGIEVGSDAD